MFVYRKSKYFDMFVQAFKKVKQLPRHVHLSIKKKDVF